MLRPFALVLLVGCVTGCGSSQDSLPVTVSFREGQIDYPSWITPGGGYTGSNEAGVFQVLIVIANNSETKKVDYTGWMTTRTGMRLTDEHGNFYSLLSYGAENRMRYIKPIQGEQYQKEFLEVTQKAIEPKQAIVDVLFFEKPIKNTKTLTLSLPRSNFGGSGDSTMTIDTSTIKNFANWDGPAK